MANWCCNLVSDSHYIMFGPVKERKAKAEQRKRTETEEQRTKEKR